MSPLPNTAAKVSDLSAAPPQMLDGIHGVILSTLMGPEDKPYLVQTVDQLRNTFGIVDTVKNPHYVGLRRALERGCSFLVQRLVGTGAAVATYTAWAAVSKITVNAKTKGTWANNTLGLIWTNSTTQTLKVVYAPNPAIEEVYTGATVDDIIAAVNAVSSLITLATTAGYAAPTTNVTPVYLTAGSDGSFADAAAKDTAINALLPRFNDLLGLDTLSAPGVYTSATLTNLVTYAESRQDLYALFELDPASDPAAAITFMGTVSTITSAYLAMYYGSTASVWSPDLLANTTMGNIFDVCGVWSVTLNDQELYKAPAGAKRGCIPNVLSYTYNMLSPARKAQADTLNDLGVNIVGQHPTFGPVVWGAKNRNMKSSSLDFIHIVHMLIDLQRTMGAIYQATLFDPMDPTTWRLAWTQIQPVLQLLQDNRVIYPGWQYIGDQDASRIEDARYNKLVDLQANKYKTKTVMVPVGYIEQIEFTLQTNGLTTMFNLGISTL